ncbi:MAG: hypothetical protein R3F37_18985 [Candidatus Competibacteraceae bacterium]
MKRLLILAIVLIASLANSVVLAFDQQHAAWDQLLKKHVVWIDNGGGFAGELRRIPTRFRNCKTICKTLSGVKPSGV